eukprot:CAMPEP_0181408602 /NCGR_PEP_ID=MMETSP1110-20121109/6383_1 /TAXON_ID=174948 /ORGANISM="Symbiodinium sp., Strain CCMP421" /LENGTH=97 /DNA_ID=CAMNT_0023531073 /DNA_START=261 /DNA_END=554 /DNA_ORIENTATION=-
MVGNAVAIKIQLCKLTAVRHDSGQLSGPTIPDLVLTQVQLAESFTAEQRGRQQASAAVTNALSAEDLPPTSWPPSPKASSWHLGKAAASATAPRSPT